MELRFLNLSQNYQINQQTLKYSQNSSGSVILLQKKAEFF